MHISKYFTKKRALIALAIITGLVLIIVVTEEALDIYAEKKENKAFAALAPDFISLCLEDTNRSDHSFILGRLRQCVYDNSIHNVDEEFYAHWRAPTSDKLRRIMNFAKGDAMEPPHMECSTRTEVLEELYLFMGYDTKKYIVAKPANEFPDHVLVEVLNPDTTKKELHDPTFNVSYNHLGTGKRLSAIDVLQTPIFEIVACSNSGECSRQQMMNDIEPLFMKMQHYYGLFYHKPDTGNKDGILSINKSRFDPEQKFEVDGEMMTYCEKKAKNCQNPIELSLIHI